MEAVILAGGFGTRLQKVVSEVPKSMAPINGRPFLEYLLDYIISQGITRVIFSVGYKSGMIWDHFKDEYKSVRIVYAEETNPLGTGGGIRNAFRFVLGDQAFTLNGDSIFRVDLQKLKGKHNQENGEITLALRLLHETSRYGTVTIDPGGRILSFREKGAQTGPGYINGGVYIIRKDFILSDRFEERFSLEKDCFEKFVGVSRFFGYPSTDYFLDIGIPEDYKKAQDEFTRF